MFILSSTSFSIPYNPILSLSFSLSLISYFSLPIPIFSSFLFTTLSHVLLSFFFFIILLPLENHREERKYFFLKPNYDLLDSGKKKKNFTSNIPPIIFRNILASQYFPLLYFPRKEEKWSGIGFEKREATERREFWKEREREKWDKSGAICKRRNAVGRNTWPLYHICGGLTATKDFSIRGWNTGEIKGREILRGTLTLFIQYIIRERSFSHLLSRD